VQEFVLEEEVDSEERLVICGDATKPACKMAVRRRKEWLAEFKGRPVCRESVRTWGQMACATMTDDENVANEQQELPNKKEREKKRKTMKCFKKQTGTADEGERKFKGWSDNGHKAFMQHTTVSKRMWQVANTIFGRRHSKRFLQCNKRQG
jgi:hypothetical protein